MKLKFDIAIKEKDSLLTESKNIIVNSEKAATNEMNLKNKVNALNEEINILKQKNESLLNSNTALTEQIDITNSKIEIQIKSLNNSHNVILEQQNSMITQLNSQLNVLNEETNLYKNQIQSYQDEIKSLKTQLNELDSKNKSQGDQIETYKNLKLHSDSAQTLELQNKNLEIKYSELQKEKNILETQYLALKEQLNNLNQEHSNTKSANNYLKTQYNDLQKSMLTSKTDVEILSKLKHELKIIYQSLYKESPENKDELTLIQAIHSKILKRFSINDLNQQLQYNEPFNSLEQNKNSQLYENIIIYIFNLKTQNTLDIYNALIQNGYSNSANYVNTNANSNNYYSHNLKKTIDDFKNEIEEKCDMFENRIRSAVNVDDFEKIISDLRKLYEQIIEYIIQAFYNSKVDLSQNKILTIQMQIDKYHQILTNVNNNLGLIEQSLKDKIKSYKGQSSTMESALNILNKYINNLS